jgi:RHS repeat-associated protein
VLGLGGEQVSELNGSGGWKHSNVFAGGRLLASYEGPAGTASAGYHFHLTDWLGSKRMQTTASGNQEEVCDSYPFGDGLSCSGGADATEHHFTGKERDAESGNDYFGARYYGSSMGRFLSPDPVGDWAASPDDPQSWNQYAYVEGNPLKMVDPDGTCPVIIAGIGMSPDSASGQDLIATAGLYGADVDFDYAGQSKLMSIANIALSGLGANGAATQSASDAMNAALADASAGGTSFFALGFSGGAQASLSAGAGSGAMNPTAFYDPGTHLFQGLGGGQEFTGSGFTSDFVRGVSGHFGGTNIPGCGHNVNCAIQRSAALQAAMKQAGPCASPQVFSRNLPPYSYIPTIPMQLLPLPSFHFIDEPQDPNGSGTVKILPGFTPVEDQ